MAAEIFEIVFDNGRRRGGDDEPPPPGAGDGDAPRPVYLSDDFLSDKLSSTILRDDWLYTASSRQWRRWNGRAWQYEQTLLVDDLARELCRREAEGVKDQKLARAVDGEATARRVERLTRALRRHAAVAEQFDADPWLLNTPGGIISLRTGQPMPHEPNAFLTKLAAVTPEPYREKDRCATWLRVLNEATGGDQRLIDYLQRLFGYGLIGVVTEHVVAVLHGARGGEGKSVIINTVAAILGDYAAVAPSDMLTPQQGERHSTDLAGLRGARLVVASEIEEGRYWAEAKLKSISGGDKVTARFMRGDFFTYQPQFTLVIATNHLPQLRSAGGMRRRLQIVPFRHRPAQPDAELPEKLKAEWPAIFSWLVEGALLWQRVGLAPPPIVEAATAEYFAAENPISAWLEERCVKDPQAETTTDELHCDYRSWATRSDEPLLTKTKFKKRLEEAGFQGGVKVRGGDRRGFLGVRLHGPGDLLSRPRGDRGERDVGRANDLPPLGALDDPGDEWDRE